jgi:hypothetical protein
MNNAAPMQDRSCPGHQQRGSLQELSTIPQQKSVAAHALCLNAFSQATWQGGRSPAGNEVIQADPLVSDHIEGPVKSEV